MATSPAKVSVTVKIEHAGQPGLIDVGGYQLYLECQGSGSPTILLEHGFSFQSWKTSHLKKLQDTSQVCFYLRPGMPGSEKAPNPPITSRDQAEILHTLLQNAGIPGPYVLVAHSIGVWTDLMYAHLYPEEVAGLVCVDCYSPQFRPAARALFGPEKADDPASVKQIRKEMTTTFHLLAPFLPEPLDSNASEVQLQEVTSLGDIPFTVLLTADAAGRSDLPKELSDGMDQLWIDTSNELAALSTAGQVIATDEITITILNAPEVIDAIREVVAAAR